MKEVLRISLRIHLGWLPDLLCFPINLRFCHVTKYLKKNLEGEVREQIKDMFPHLTILILFQILRCCLEKFQIAWEVSLSWDLSLVYFIKEILKTYFYIISTTPLYGGSSLRKSRDYFAVPNYINEYFAENFNQEHPGFVKVPLNSNCLTDKENKDTQCRKDTGKSVPSKEDSKNHDSCPEGTKEMAPKEETIRKISSSEKTGNTTTGQENTEKGFSIEDTGNNTTCKDETNEYDFFKDFPKL
ncbi:hypothetical protein SK128_015114 [Halocaridina rubra]|uniref:Uncharacterized protein n=1 Tax=Halocaridina rubra TaxID=373956 RepID=A0AAN8WR84_HALRR